MIHTGVLFDPVWDPTSSHTYQLGSHLTQEAIKEGYYASRVSQIGKQGVTGTAFPCSIGGHRFVAKYMAIQNSAKQEFANAVALVEPPTWKHDTSNGGPLTPLAVQEAEQWLRKRRRHPGFEAILHYRYYAELDRGAAIILMDACERTLCECLTKDHTFMFETADPSFTFEHHDKRPAPMLKQPDVEHPIGQAIKQVLQGIHYLVYMAGVMHCDLHMNNVMRKAGGRWCIIDFGDIKDVSAAVAGTLRDAVCDRFVLLPTVIQVRGNASCKERDGTRKLTLAKQFTTSFVSQYHKQWWSDRTTFYLELQNHFNQLCPYLGDILVLYKYSKHSSYNKLPPQTIDVVNLAVNKALHGYDWNESQAAPCNQPTAVHASSPILTPPTAAGIASHTSRNKSKHSVAEPANLLPAAVQTFQARCEQAQPSSKPHVHSTQHKIGSSHTSIARNTRLDAVQQRYGGPKASHSFANYAPPFSKRNNNDAVMCGLYIAGAMMALYMMTTTSTYATRPRLYASTPRAPSAPA